MNTYDFSTLNSSDLEELACDLLNEKHKSQGIYFKTFRDGKDKGIDLLYSTNNQHEIIGQVKHYIQSGYKKLIYDLKHVEIDKVKKLRPNRYLIITSVDLTVGNQQEIMETFRPFIKDIHDIIGKKDLNRLLDEFPNTLIKHFKLWYSSTMVLQKILAYDIDSRSIAFTESEFKKSLRLYVQTPVFNHCREILDTNGFIVITGEPGIGKTTTANILSYEYIVKGYEFTYLDKDIKDTDRILTNDDKKQLIYYDDFLGHNSYEIAQAKAEESTLIRLIRRINSSTNKKFILTTRTFILNSAIEESENLRRLNLKRKESIITLSEYNADIKLQILRNHIEESNLSDIHLDILSRDYIQQFIINHHNFSPRSIEFITSNENVAQLDANEYEQFIKYNFNTPDEIWKHAYENQIDDIARFLLNALVMSTNAISISELELQFNSRLNYEVTTNNYIKPMNAFRKSFKKLEGGFINLSSNGSHCWFINNSLVDFLIKYLKGDRDEVIRMSESVLRIDQLTERLFPLGENENKKYISLKLRNRILNSPESFINNDYIQYDTLTYILFLHDYIDLQDSENLIIALINKLDDKWNVIIDTPLQYHITEFLKSVNSSKIIEQLKAIVPSLFNWLIYEEHNLKHIKELIQVGKSKFSINFSELFNSESDPFFEEHFTSLINQQIADDIEDLLNYSHAEDYVDEKEQATKELVKFFEGFDIKLEVNISEYGAYDWWQIGIDNYMIEQMQKDF